MNLSELAPPLLLSGRVVFILAGAAITALFVNRLIRGVWLYFVKTVQNRRGVSNEELEKQASTIVGILRKLTTMVILLMAIAMALREMGFDIAPVLASAGVAGLAIGFGAQNLVRDVISGFFLLVENQIRVGDEVVVNDVPGTVEELNLRTTVLRDMEGTVHVFPNGAIAKLANRTHDFSYYLFHLHLAYQDDPDRAIVVMRSVAEELALENEFRPLLLGPLEVLGVDQLGESHVHLKARIRTRPGRQWEVGREMNRRLKVRLFQAGFDFPAKGPRKIEILNHGLNRDELKGLIREALEEARGEEPKNNG